MNKHFHIIYRKSMIACLILFAAAIGIFSYSLSSLMAGGTKFWIIGLVVAGILFFIDLLSISSNLSAGIDVKDNIVIFPDIDISKGKIPQFNLKDLKDVILRDGEGKELDPQKDSLYGARFAFVLKDGQEKLYYPVAITAKQFETVKNGLLGNTAL